MKTLKWRITFNLQADETEESDLDSLHKRESFVILPEKNERKRKKREKSRESSKQLKRRKKRSKSPAGKRAKKTKNDESDEHQEEEWAVSLLSTTIKFNQSFQVRQFKKYFCIRTNNVISICSASNFFTLQFSSWYAIDIAMTMIQCKFEICSGQFRRNGNDLGQVEVEEYRRKLGRIELKQSE